MIRFFFLSLLIFLHTAAFAENVCSGSGPNVILITVDGVRPREFFKGTAFPLDLSLPKAKRGSLMTQFWSKHASEGEVFGGLGFEQHYRIAARISVSLPSYHALFLGKPDFCKGNRCGRVTEETFLERIKRELGLAKNEVAVIASWEKIAYATEHEAGALTVNAGQQDLNDGTDDPEIKKVNEAQALDPAPWEDGRKDRYTLAHAFHYLKKHCPRVLYVSLGDADEWGHRHNYANYVNAIRNYDEALDQFIRTLDQMGQYGRNTTLFFTTDHGRGFGPLWFTHHTTRFSEKNVFLYVRGPTVSPRGRVRGAGLQSQLTLRPQIEKWMGLMHRDDSASDKE